MLKPEEKTISLFNTALKTCINLELEPNKYNAKELVYSNIFAIKEALYDCTLLDNGQIKKSLDYWQKVKLTLDSL